LASRQNLGKVGVMKWHTLLVTAFSLALCTASRADDAADCNRAMQAPDAAITACARMLDGASDENRRKILVQRSRAYSLKKQFDSALADVDQIAVLEPNKDTTIMARAYVHAVMKDYEAADADYSEILKLDRNSLVAVVGRCNERSVSKHNTTDALADCDTAVARLGNPSPSLCARGMIYLRLGRFQDALTDYDLAVRNNLPFAKCYYGRGIARLHLGDVEGSKADLAKGLTIMSSVADDFAPFGLTPP
jgi:tetratricopeptide (TPR) repeat protein